MNATYKLVLLNVKVEDLPAVAKGCSECEHGWLAVGRRNLRTDGYNWIRCECGEESQ